MPSDLDLGDLGGHGGTSRRTHQAPPTPWASGAIADFWMCHLDRSWAQRFDRLDSWRAPQSKQKLAWLPEVPGVMIIIKMTLEMRQWMGMMGASLNKVPHSHSPVMELTFIHLNIAAIAASPCP